MRGSQRAPPRYPEFKSFLRALWFAKTLRATLKEFFLHGVSSSVWIAGRFVGRPFFDCTHSVYVLVFHQIMFDLTQVGFAGLTNPLGIWTLSVPVNGTGQLSQVSAFGREAFAPAWGPAQ